MILTVICWLIHVESTIGLNVGNFVVNSWEQLPRPSTPLPEARAYHSAISTVSESGDYSMLVWGGHNGSVIVGDLSEEPQIVWVSVAVCDIDLLLFLSPSLSGRMRRDSTRPLSSGQSTNPKEQTHTVGLLTLRRRC